VLNNNNNNSEDTVAFGKMVVCLLISLIFNGLLHIQCLIENRQAVTAWIKDIFEEFKEDNPDHLEQPVIAELPSKMESPKNSVRTFNTTGTKHTKATFKSIIQATPSKYAAMITNLPPAQPGSKATKTFIREVPKAINVKSKSYAQILVEADKAANSNRSRASDNSTLETTSTTKTQREIEL
jgi:hypothetical protein